MRETANVYYKEAENTSYNLGQKWQAYQIASITEWLASKLEAKEVT